jgi:hypothetical protein
MAPLAPNALRVGMIVVAQHRMAGIEEEGEITAIDVDPLTRFTTVTVNGRAFPLDQTTFRRGRARTPPPVFKGVRTEGSPLQRSRSGSGKRRKSTRRRRRYTRHGTRK